MGILSEDKYSGIKQLFVYSFRKKNKLKKKQFQGVFAVYGYVYNRNENNSPLYIFIYKGRFGHRFGSKITLIGCTGSVRFLHLGGLSSNPVYFWWFSTFQVNVSSREM